MYMCIYTKFPKIIQFQYNKKYNLEIELDFLHYNS